MNFDSDTKKVFNFILRSLHLLGLHPDEDSSALYATYSILFNFTFTICYPATMLVELFSSHSSKDLFTGSSSTITCVMDCLKAMNLIHKRQQLTRIRDLLGEMDRRMKKLNDPEERRYMEKIITSAGRIVVLFAALYGFCAIVCIVSLVFSENDKCRVICCQLDWFPDQWKLSRANFFGTCIYQLFGVSILLLGNLAGDMCSGLCLWMLRGHFHLLNRRASKVGYTKGHSRIDVYQTLIECIEEQKMILECCDKFEVGFEKVLFLQLFVTELNLCVIAICFRYIQTQAELIYTVLYFLAMFCEIFLICYGGNEMVYESEQFTNALYACNWMEQDGKFKRTLMIVLLRTQKPAFLYAGGIVTVSLPTVLMVLKSAYSLFAIADQIR